jgi:hypothetical protein
MSKFSDQDRKRIMAEARRNIERPRPVIEAEAPREPIKYRVTDYGLDEEAAAMPQPEPPRLDTSTQQDRLREFNEWIKPYWTGMIEVTKESIARVLDRERREHQRDLADEVRSLTIQLTSLQETTDELRAVLDAERRGNGTVVDWPRARASN